MYVCMNACMYIFIHFVSCYLLRNYNLPRTVSWTEKTILKKLPPTYSRTVTPGLCYPGTHQQTLSVS